MHECIHTIMHAYTLHFCSFLQQKMRSRFEAPIPRQHNYQQQQQYQVCDLRKAWNSIFFLTPAFWNM